MFLPSSAETSQQQEVIKRKAYSRVEEWSKELIPEGLRSDVHISVQEVQCGDPNCSPVDTSVTILFNSGGRGMLGIPMEANDVTTEELEHVFPPPNILEQWHQGRDAEWPPSTEAAFDMPTLRFAVGTRVMCRVGADLLTGWAPGVVTQLWYRERTWPEGSWAPYKVQLDDGRDIFAPGDMDAIIKQHPGDASTGDAAAAEVAE